MRPVAKRLIEKSLRLLLASGGRTRGQSLILAYHNVVPDALAGRGDRSLHIPFSRFTRHLDLIQTHCRVAPLVEILAGTSFDQGPVVGITFDDAYRGAVELGLPELARRKLPSTLFVAPGLLESHGFWWDELADPSRGLSPEIREAALKELGGSHPRIRATIGSGRSAERLPDCYGCAGETEVRSLGGLGTVTLGSHSWSHPNLRCLDTEELSGELTRSLEWLTGVRTPTVKILAYPYGLCSPAVAEAAERAGYTEALLIEGGWFTKEAGRWAVPRYNVPAGLSEDGLMLRLSGILSPAASAGR